ncbi:MAG: hypothetical protein IJH12_05170 [Clostridia bacterium]|nr:hypothetical protein [Clostridia bacterium]
MTQRQIINLVETTLIDKIIKDPNYIKYTYFEVNVRYTQEYELSNQDIGSFLHLAREKLKEKGYKVYTEGQKFEYNNAKHTVQSNELIIAIKEQKDEA